MRIFIVATIAALLAGPAYAQGLGLPLSTDKEKTSLTEEERQKKEQLDRAYNSATKKAQGQDPGAFDPWRNVRAPASAPKNPAKPKPGVK